MTLFATDDTYVRPSLTAPAGQAGAQGVLIDKSEIRFISRQMGVNVEGRFRRIRFRIP